MNYEEIVAHIESNDPVRKWCFRYALYMAANTDRTLKESLEFATEFVQLNTDWKEYSPQDAAEEEISYWEPILDGRA